MATFWSTLIALTAVRRSVPIALTVAALIAVQLHYGDGRAALVPAGMSLGFVGLAPWAWRTLLASQITPARVAGYVVLAILVVGAFGVGLPAALDIGPTFLTDSGSLSIAAMLFLVGGWGLGRDIELEQDLEHLRLKAVRAHLDPHFLYNTLNAIAEWCREDPAVAEEATTSLADILRSTLDALELRSWPIARELAMVDDLLALHRIRDPEAFTANVVIDPGVAALELPPLVLVGIVENAIKHGPRNGHRGPIAIAVTAIDGGVRCEVDNPGRFAPAAGHAGRGLQTLRARLALAYGRRARFTIATLDTDRTRAVLDLRPLPP
jgi:two-component system sensor histidine kinase AlgZ